MISIPSTNNPIGQLVNPLVPEGIYVRPCVNGSSASHLFPFSEVSETNCSGKIDCTNVNNLPGAWFIYPISLSLLGVTGQIWALVCLYRSTRLHNTRTVFYVMLSTLIWTDLIGKIITTPFPLLAYASKHWVGGSPSCQMHGYAMCLIGVVTHLLVALMAIERYLGIRHGYFYAKNITTTRTRLVLLSVWLFGIFLASFPLFGVGIFKLHYPGTWCYLTQHLCPDQALVHRIYGNSVACLNMFCLQIIVFCNVFVVGSLLKMRVTKARPSDSGKQHRSSGKHELELQMVIVLVIITIVFVTSWSLHDVLLFRNEIWPAQPDKNPLFDIVAIRLVSINQIVDPWVYIICRVIFRSKLWNVCRRFLIGPKTYISNSIRSERLGSLINYIRRKDSKNLGSELHSMDSTDHHFHSCPPVGESTKITRIEASVKGFIPLKPLRGATENEKNYVP